MTQFICIEGGEGVGKSSLIASLQDYFATCGKEVVITRQPGGTEISERIREVFLKDYKLHAYSELSLLLADRAHHLKTIIKPAMDAGKIILCDRYHMSSYVYQGILGGLSKEYIANMIHNMYAALELSSEDTYYPDLYLLLDCPVEISQQRLQKRSSQDHEVTRFDLKQKAFHEKLRTAYIDVSQSMSNVTVLNAQKEPAEVLQQAVLCLESMS